jgi:hypothetical protein
MCEQKKILKKIEKERELQAGRITRDDLRQICCFLKEIQE